MIAVLLLSCVFICSCANKESVSKVPELLEPAMGTEKTAVAAIRDVYTFEGYSSYVIPKLHELSFTDGGQLESIDVTIGEKVEEGQELARLKSSSEAYEDLLKRYNDMREENAYNNRQREIEIEIAQINNTDCERLKLIDSQQRQLQRLDENYILSRVNLEKEKLSAGIITAPCSGVVSSVGNILSGTYVDEGKPVIVLADSRECFVYCEYMPSVSVKAYESMTAIIDGDEYLLSYVPYGEGEVTKLIDKGEDYYTIFKVEGGRSEIIGLPASICLKKNIRSSVLSVPVNAIHRENGSSYVYARMNGSKQPVSVKTGVVGNMYAEILEGLKEGDVVYVTD